jgi:hypothetical protein
MNSMAFWIEFKAASPDVMKLAVEPAETQDFSTAFLRIHRIVSDCESAHVTP